MRVTAFREEVKFLSTIAYRVTNQLLAVVIALRGVNHVQAGIERTI